MFSIWKIEKFVQEGRCKNCDVTTQTDDVTMCSWKLVLLKILKWQSAWETAGNDSLNFQLGLRNARPIARHENNSDFESVILYLLIIIYFSATVKEDPVTRTQICPLSDCFFAIWNEKQCSRQLQCEVPCGVSNVVNSSLFINSSLSSLSSTSHAICKGGVSHLQQGGVCL